MKKLNHENRRLMLVPSKPEGGIFRNSLPKTLTGQRALQQFLEQFSRDQNIFANLGMFKL